MIVTRFELRKEKKFAAHLHRSSCNEGSPLTINFFFCSHTFWKIHWVTSALHLTCTANYLVALYYFSSFNQNWCVPVYVSRQLCTQNQSYLTPKIYQPIELNVDCQTKKKTITTTTTTTTTYFWPVNALNSRMINTTLMLVVVLNRSSHSFRPFGPFRCDKEIRAINFQWHFQR